MKNKIFLTIFLFAAVLCSAVMIKGRVTDTAGIALENVLVKSSLVSTVTKLDGSFTLNCGDTDSLLFHRLGFNDTLIPVKDLQFPVQLNKIAYPLSGVSISAELKNDKSSQQIKKIKLNDGNYSGSLADIINSSTAMISQGTELAGNKQVVSMPGFDPRHTLVLLDGIPLNADGEDVDLSMIPEGMLEEIEIMSGNTKPASASSAMGMVINLKTKTIEPELHYEVKGQTGSYDHYLSSALVGWGNENIRFQASAAYQQAENDFKFEAPEFWNLNELALKRKNNSFKQLDISALVKANVKRHIIEYKGFYTDYFRMLPGPVNNPELFYKARISGYTNNHQIRWKKSFFDLNTVCDMWINQIHSTYDNTRLEEPFSNYPLYCVYSKTSHQNTGLRPLLRWQSTDNIKLEIGTSWQEGSYKYTEETYPDNSISQIKRNTFSAFSGADLVRDYENLKFLLSTSLHYDNSSDFDPGHSYVFSGSILHERDLICELQGSFGRSFTLPSFYNLYYKGSNEVAGNPDLEPESGFSGSVGSSIKNEKFSLSVNFRRDKLNDMIAWIQNFNKTWKPVNISSAEVTNLELSAGLSLFSPFRISGIINFTSSKDKTILPNGDQAAFYDKELIYTPDYSGSLQLHWQPGSLQLSLNARFTGQQWTTRDQLTPDKELAAYQLYDLKMKWEKKIAPLTLVLELKINNLLDETYPVYEYIPQPGRNILFNITIIK